MTLNSIGTCLLKARLYRMAKEELAKHYGTNWSNERRRIHNYSSFLSLPVHSDTRMKSLSAAKTMIKKETKKKKKKIKFSLTTLKPIGRFLKSVSVWLGLTKNSTTEKNYDNPIINRYVYHMNRFKNIFPSYKNSDIKILHYNKWNATIQCNVLSIQMVILGGILRVYVPERGIVMQKASCHGKDYVKTFDTLTKTWIDGCFPSFKKIEKSFKKRLDVTEMNIPLSRVTKKNVVGIIEYLTGRQESNEETKTKIVSIWAKSDENDNITTTSTNLFTPSNITSCII
uniref:Wsv134-like protein n=1 Tax=Metapenaeus ensis majanivirus TaxID=2984279 RepID=A0A9C7BI88_9VIRU|nr:MAG: wsv134-like protein [Metapenaeus ensis majanivirus]